MKHKNIASLFALVAFGFLAIASTDEETTGTSSAKSQGGVQVGINEPLTLNGIEWVVLSHKKVSSFPGILGELGDPIRPVDETTTFVQVSGKTTNKNKGTDLELGDLYLVDGEGAEYAQHEESLSGVEFAELSRNVPKKWSAVFELPKSAPAPLKLKVTDGDILSESSGYILLE